MLYGERGAAAGVRHATCSVERGLRPLSCEAYERDLLGVGRVSGRALGPRC